jgi:hypothetical protein
MIREDLIAERTVIEVYQRMIEFFGEKDPTTRRLIEHIKGEEEEHASELSDMMFIVNPETGEGEGQDPGTDPLQYGSRGGQKTAFVGSRGHEAIAEDESSMDEDEVDETEEVATSRKWGNEANVGKLGKGSPVRRSTAPKETGWGNEHLVAGGEGHGRSESPKRANAKSAKVEKAPVTSKGGARSPKIVQKGRKNKRAA